MANCSICGKKFSVGEKRYRFGNKQVCLDCMTCSVCGSKSRGEKRYLVGTQAFCEQCAKARKLDLLTTALFTYMTGYSSYGEGMISVIGGFLDPVAGLYWRSAGVGTQQKIQDARETIKQIYSEQPDLTIRYIEDSISQFESLKSDIGRKQAVKARALLDWLKQAERKTPKEDPLTILKLRYVKGEITKKQYEEMKTTLQTD